MRILYALMLSTLLSGCVSLPEGVQPVHNFDLNRYLGKWYEIARLDHSFERGLDGVTAEYSLRDDGGVRVINKGYSKEDNEWQGAEGKAYFVKSENDGYLKVSFFGPFYGAYIIYELDHEGYQYSFVSGPNKSYLWLLARSPSVDKELLEQFVSMSKQLGFNTDSLIYVNHKMPD